MEKTIGIIGLGYVGLPLAVEFGKRRRVIGFDVDARRIAELRRGHDHTLEVEAEELAAAPHLTFTAAPEELAAAEIFIVTVPTPVDAAKRPDVTALVRASETIGARLKRGDIVIYESTVYPGCTEEVCVPVLERCSGLRFNVDFFCGYSPERINPGDKHNRLPSITKVTSGSTPEIAEQIDAMYRDIISAGTHKASSIKVAEAAKVIENTQRDVNIALMNELSLIFERLGIDTLEVLEAAGTKWNFLPFRPGLVGGHCIGVDPYYLTYKAQQIDYHPEVILAGRRINDRMGEHVADRIVKLMLARDIQPLNARVLMLGLAFKENCPDTRNTRAIDIVHGLRAYRLNVDVYDPWVDAAEVRREYRLDCLNDLPIVGGYDAVVIAVGHRQFVELGADALRALGRPGAVLFDVKGILPQGSAEGRL
ncbi:Vi polysaccharide biosynthesis UDP-N-acetylglucosamine C-6 dehydrogenase TviB [Sphingomonas yunnanensis]|uniref:Vi polysaccharide biosynthesis UDP-N-acetylglucosamine C-6 dehydrogenase TviB n=1 Tax=Sphingomonas yunnanensis TaxID=310400 RepID=UPI001CA6EAD6|nr:Vi polysaccharide biosynthesis UDP-N-acetylglucosamine C-6 dehydrogenase TviB [Sphingomonas yunnanensis]MBY9063457.1 Vi polysaccharide biosynthesis UDP-N-acetylglucosamine C-6 dehydrogenase TviB [Sphingomonas yunnanensis]